MDRREFLFESIAGFVAVSIGDLSFAENDLLFHGQIARADVPNGNRRLYPRRVLEQVVANFNKEHKLTKTMLGELGTPSDAAVIHFKNTSHLVKDLRMENGYLVGEFKIINTSSGDKLKQLIKEQKVVFRTRGFGTVKVNEHGVAVIQGDYKLISVDAISVESATVI